MNPKSSLPPLNNNKAVQCPFRTRKLKKRTKDQSKQSAELKGFIKPESFDFTAMQAMKDILKDACNAN